MPINFVLPSVVSGVALMTGVYTSQLLNRLASGARMPVLMPSNAFVHFGGGHRDVVPLFANHEDAIAHQIINDLPRALSDEGVGLVELSMDPSQDMLPQTIKKYQFAVTEHEIKRRNGLIQIAKPGNQTGMSNEILTRVNNPWDLTVNHVDSRHVSAGGQNSFKLWKIDSGLKNINEVVQQMKQSVQASPPRLFLRGGI